MQDHLKSSFVFFPPWSWIEVHKSYLEQGCLLIMNGGAQESEQACFLIMDWGTQEPVKTDLFTGHRLGCKEPVRTDLFHDHALGYGSACLQPHWICVWLRFCCLLSHWFNQALNPIESVCEILLLSSKGVSH